MMGSFRDCNHLIEKYSILNNAQKNALKLLKDQTFHQNFKGSYASQTYSMSHVVLFILYEPRLRTTKMMTENNNFNRFSQFELRTRIIEILAFTQVINIFNKKFLYLTSLCFTLLLAWGAFSSKRGLFSKTRLNNIVRIKHFCGPLTHPRISRFHALLRDVFNRNFCHDTSLVGSPHWTETFFLFVKLH